MENKGHTFSDTPEERWRYTEKVLKNYICTTEETEDLLNRLESSTVVSVIDLRNAFLQVPLDEASKQLTTKSTPYSLFKYNFLPFGLSAAPKSGRWNKWWLTRSPRVSRRFSRTRHESRGTFQKSTQPSTVSGWKEFPNQWRQMQDSSNINPFSRIYNWCEWHSSKPEVHECLGPIEIAYEFRWIKKYN